MYERLILSFRWAEVDVGRLRLLANLPPGFDGLSAQITKDGILFEALSSAGFVQFAKGPDYDYDPICFDLSTRDAAGECRVGTVYVFGENVPLRPPNRIRSKA